MDDAPYTEDLDLAASSTGELAALLRTVHLRADKPSLRAIEKKTRHDATPLSKTILSEMLRGIRFPRKAVMIGFLSACGVPDDQLAPWRRAWDRVAELDHGGPKEELGGNASVIATENAQRGRRPGSEASQRPATGTGEGLSAPHGPAATPKEAAPAVRRAWNGMYGEFGELRQAIERALAQSKNNTSADINLTFESYEIRPGMVTFSVILRPSHQRILLRVDDQEYLRAAERERFLEEVELAQEISSHLHVAKIIGGDFTSEGHPFVLQVTEESTVPYRLPLHVAQVIEIGKALADALDYAHNMDGSFGIIEPSHILQTADGDPVLSFPHLPMLVSLDDAAAEARDVYGLCAALLSMLPPLQGMSAPSEPNRGTLEFKVRDLLESGIQEQARLRPSATVLREKFYGLAREASGTWDNAEISRRISISGEDGSIAAEILVKAGDLFNDSPNIVISFSDTFDTDTSITDDGRVIISPSSLQGQLLRHIYDGDIDALDRDLDHALASAPIERLESRNKKALGKLKRYEIGTVAVLERLDKKIFAVAVSRMGGNLTARSSYQFLEKSLHHLWDEIRRRGCDSVAMPIIGSGLARVDVSSYNLFDLITSSFRAQTQIEPICSQLRIIIHPSDRETARRIDTMLSTHGFSG